MIDLKECNACICRKFSNIHKLCVNQFTITEQGKSVRLMPRPGEEAVAIVLDGCVFTDQKTRCDALFLYKTRNKYTFLVELKGANDITKAFEQLHATRQRREYKEIIRLFKDIDQRTVTEKFAIVSNGMLAKPQIERLEQQYNIRVKKILYCEGTTPVPDLKQLL